jgi:cytochrome d ubiquinol oxidase subunit I
MIGTTLALYLAIYALLMIAYISVLFHLARKAGGPGTAPPPAYAVRLQAAE